MLCDRATADGASRLARARGAAVRRLRVKGVEAVVPASSFRVVLRGRRVVARVHVDPVCGMKVAVSSPYRSRYVGRTILLCSAGCLARFVRDPGAFASPSKP